MYYVAVQPVFKTGSLTPHFPPSRVPGIHHSTFSLYESDDFQVQSQCMSLCDWFTPLKCNVFKVHPCCITWQDFLLFSKPNNILLESYFISHILFVHSSRDGHSGCFHILAIVSGAAMNVYLQHTGSLLTQQLHWVQEMITVWEIHRNELRMRKSQIHIYPVLLRLGEKRVFCLLSLTAGCRLHIFSFMFFFFLDAYTWWDSPVIIKY